MVTCKVDIDKKHCQDIWNSLVKFNKEQIGEKFNVSNYFYIEQSDSLQGAITTNQSWDWATINHLYYPDLETLELLLSQVCDTYRESALGIRFASIFVK